MLRIRDLVGLVRGRADANTKSGSAAIGPNSYCSRVTAGGCGVSAAAVLPEVSLRVAI